MPWYRNRIVNCASYLLPISLFLNLSKLMSEGTERGKKHVYKYSPPPTPLFSLLFSLLLALHSSWDMKVGLYILLETWFLSRWSQRMKQWTEFEKVKVESLLKNKHRLGERERVPLRPFFLQDSFCALISPLIGHHSHWFGHYSISRAQTLCEEVKFSSSSPLLFSYFLLGFPLFSLNESTLLCYSVN